jgi:hypothetical protein
MMEKCLSGVSVEDRITAAGGHEDHAAVPEENHVEWQVLTVTNRCKRSQ